MNDKDWIKRRIAEAKRDRPLVMDTVLTRLEGLLGGHLSEAQLSKKQLTSIAGDLLRRMTPQSAKAEDDR